MSHLNSPPRHATSETALDVRSVLTGLQSQLYPRSRLQALGPTADPDNAPVTPDDELTASPIPKEPIDADPLPPFPTFPDVLRRFGRQFVVDALAPVVLFLALSGAAGLIWAIAAASIWSAVLVVTRWRAERSVGPLVWFSLGFALLRGAAGILTRSGTVYFAPLVVGNFAVAVVFSGSALVGRPIVGLIAKIFYPFPDEVVRHHAYRRVFIRVTLAWAAEQALIGLLQVVLLATTTTNTYVIVRSLVAWPLNLGLFVFSLRYARRALSRELNRPGSDGGSGYWFPTPVGAGCWAA